MTRPSESTTRAVVPDVPWSSARTTRELTRARASRAHEPEREVGAVADHDIHAEADDAADIGLLVHRPRRPLEAGRPRGRHEIGVEEPEVVADDIGTDRRRLPVGVMRALTAYDQHNWGEGGGERWRDV